MKLIKLSLAVLMLARGAQAGDLPIRNMASELPTVPDGQSIATYPVPRTDWVEQVNDHIEKSRKMASPIEVVLDGDSITWLFQKRKFWEQSFPNVMTFNFAMSGDRTQHLLWRIFQGQIDHLRPKLVILLIGTNNLGTGQSVGETVAGIKAVVAEYRQRCPDSTLLLHGIFPRGEGADHPFRAQIRQVNEAISKLADGEKIVYVDFGDHFLAPDGGVDPKLFADYLHPNKEGFKVWSAALKPYVEKFAGAKER